MKKNIFDSNQSFVLCILVIALVFIVILASMLWKYQLNLDFRQDETEVHFAIIPPTNGIEQDVGDSVYTEFPGDSIQTDK